MTVETIKGLPGNVRHSKYQHVRRYLKRARAQTVRRTGRIMCKILREALDPDEVPPADTRMIGGWAD